MKYVVITRGSANDCEHHECKSKEAMEELMVTYKSWGFSEIEVYEKIETP